MRACMTWRRFHEDHVTIAWSTRSALRVCARLVDAWETSAAACCIFGVIDQGFRASEEQEIKKDAGVVMCLNEFWETALRSAASLASNPPGSPRLSKAPTPSRLPKSPTQSRFTKAPSVSGGSLLPSDRLDKPQGKDGDARVLSRPGYELMHAKLCGCMASDPGADDKLAAHDWSAANRGVIPQMARESFHDALFAIAGEFVNGTSADSYVDWLLTLFGRVAEQVPHMERGAGGGTVVALSWVWRPHVAPAPEFAPGYDKSHDANVDTDGSSSEDEQEEGGVLGDGAGRRRRKKKGRGSTVPFDPVAAAAAEAIAREAAEEAAAERAAAAAAAAAAALDATEAATRVQSRARVVQAKKVRQERQDDAILQST